MTAIRLDPMTLAEVRAGKGPIYFCTEAGTPVLRCVVTPALPLDQEPSEEELAASEAGETYSLAEVMDYIHGLEKK